MEFGQVAGILLAAIIAPALAIVAVVGRMTKEDLSQPVDRLWEQEP